MHMADALLAPAVAATMYAASAVTVGASVKTLKKDEATQKLPTMAVTSALVFAGQMINYTIPGTGSSGHLCGGMLLSALLGPQAGFLSMTVILAIQALFFADGGLLALGANCWNMAFYGCFVGYYLLWKPIITGRLLGKLGMRTRILLSSVLGPQAGFLSMTVILAIQALFFADGGLLALGANCWNMAFYGCFVGYYLLWKPIITGRLLGKLGMRTRILLSSVLGCMITLQLGAFSVVLETSASGITELPFGGFVAIMQPIHLAIGLVEGLITSAVLVFVYEARPELLMDVNAGSAAGKCSLKTTLVILALVVAIVGGGLSLFASSNPDGLEWSMFGNAEAGYSENMGLDEESYGISGGAAEVAGAIQEKTAFLPDYAFAGSDSSLGTSVSGILGSAIVAAVAAGICMAGGFFRRKKAGAKA